MDKKLAILTFYSGCITIFVLWQKDKLEKTENEYNEFAKLCIGSSIEELETLFDDLSEDRGLSCTPSPLEGDLWDCGEVIYKVVNFEQGGYLDKARTHLGPYLAPSKSLEEWGCRYDYSIPNDGMRCYREKAVPQLKSLLAFYSFNLIQVEQ
jgi:hypothetical protein